ncbi:hypothetical protein CEP52_007677 [Fusarium oligoseptatum]|uniref:Uncharacterized protein n=1 Tax=Fusarium oligoseptatum TaxID=2604345 RepID=A0A428TLZ1_9HYPO|nr:hypothetical protein CEP52_007677 [Fusarium oligoseptatum]
MATTSARGPLIEDIIYHVGLCFVPEPWEMAPTPTEADYFEMDMYYLRKLTYLSRATKRLLEPLLFRFVLLSKPQDVVHFYIDLIQIPRIREYVRHLACVTHRRSPGSMSDLRVNRVLQKILDERIGGRENKLSLMKQGAAWEPFAQACSVTNTTPEQHLGPGFNMRGNIDYMIRSILLTTTKLKTLVWQLDEFYSKSSRTSEILISAARHDHVLLPDLEVMALNPHPASGCRQYSHLQDFSWERGCWKNLRRLVLYDTDFDVDFEEMIFKGLGFEVVVPVEELIVMRREGQDIRRVNSSLDAVISSHGAHRPWDEENLPIFENLKLLDVSFGYFSRRNQEGSAMLETFLRWVGCPERLRLTGHPPPFNALGRGAVHSRLKSIRVKEWMDEEDLEQGEVRQKVEDWWRGHSAVVPNLEEFIVQRVEESKVYATKP